MLTTVFHDSPFLALDALYPNRFKPWELSSAHLNYWTHEHGIAATKWPIEEKLRWGKGDIVENINASLFKENGLGRMLHSVFHDSPFEAINSLYPNEFKPWEMNRVPLTFGTVKRELKQHDGL